jgi:hypothetical protein
MKQSWPDRPQNKMVGLFDGIGDMIDQVKLTGKNKLKMVVFQT